MGCVLRHLSRRALPFNALPCLCFALLQPYCLLENAPGRMLLGVGMAAPLALVFLSRSLYACELAHLPLSAAPSAPHASVAGGGLLCQSSTAASAAAAAAAAAAANCISQSVLFPGAAWREQLVVALRLYVVAFINFVSIRTYQVGGVGGLR